MWGLTLFTSILPPIIQSPLTCSTVCTVTWLQRGPWWWMTTWNNVQLKLWSSCCCDQQLNGFSTYFRSEWGLCRGWRVCSRSVSPGHQGGSPGRSAPPRGSPDSTGQDPLWCRTDTRHNLYFLKRREKKMHRWPLWKEFAKVKMYKCTASRLHICTTLRYPFTIANTLFHHNYNVLGLCVT